MYLASTDWAFRFPGGKFEFYGAVLAAASVATRQQDSVDPAVETYLALKLHLMTFFHGYIRAPLLCTGGGGSPAAPGEGFIESTHTGVLSSTGGGGLGNGLNYQSSV